MTTAGDMIALALRDCGAFGVGQTAQAQDTSDALNRLNYMISQWNARRWLVYHLVDTGFACTGAISYTVYLGGNFNIARPDQIAAAYIRQPMGGGSSPVDWPLTLIPSREDYSRLALKTLSASPSEALFYDSGFPQGRVYPWPVPSAPYELHILTKEVLQSFATTATVISLPGAYYEGLLYGLINRLRAAYRLAPDPVFLGLEKAALATIRKTNTQISNLRMPRAIRNQGSRYNLYSDASGR